MFGVRIKTTFSYTQKTPQKQRESVTENCSVKLCIFECVLSVLFAFLVNNYIYVHCFICLLCNYEGLIVLYELTIHAL